MSWRPDPARPSAMRLPDVRSSSSVVLFVAGAALSASLLQAQPPQPTDPVWPLPVAATADARVAAIGERLFGDVRLSAGSTYSCATCHPLDRGGMDGLDVASLPGVRLSRNTPTVFNVGFNATLNWDGAFDTLEAHTERVLESLMRIGWTDLLARLRGDPAYVRDFTAVFGSAPTRTLVVDAIATFERSLVTPGSRFDRYLSGDEGALSEAEREGYVLFTRYGCSSCHQGVNIGGNLFQRFGVFQDLLPPRPGPADPGRFRVTGAMRDERVFRVPSLRNVAVTAPYFHDGREGELEGAVEIMARAQLGRSLPKADIARIAGFLRTLTGEYRGVPVGAEQQPVGARQQQGPR